MPHRPEFSELQVVGKNYDKNIENSAETSTSKDFEVNDTWCNPKVFDKENKPLKDGEYEPINNHYLIDTSDDPFSNQPDIVREPVFGPCISFGGQTAKWTGNGMENKGIVALESRLNFETKAGKRVLATFEIHNIGTTVIYFDWKVSFVNVCFGLLIG